MKTIRIKTYFREQRRWRRQDQPAAYAAALRLVVAIDAGLTSRRVHYRTVDDRLLTCLDEVIAAILDGSLKLADEGMREAV